jgi:hypothetical protein
MTGIRVTVAPARIGLGEPFTVTVDAQGTGILSAPDGPFVEVGAPRIAHSGGHIRIVKTLVCVDRDCAPDGKPRTVSLPAATLASGAATTRSARATVTIVPRVPASAVSASRAAYRAPTSVPAVTSPFPLALAAAFAIVVACLCVVAAALALRRRPRPSVSSPLRWDLPLALRLLRESTARPASDRRRAADLVAVLTDDAAATRLAWAPPEPAPADVERLADRVARSGRE